MTYDNDFEEPEDMAEGFLVVLSGGYELPEFDFMHSLEEASKKYLTDEFIHDPGTRVDVMKIAVNHDGQMYLEPKGSVAHGDEV